MRISILTKFLLTILAVALLTLGPVTFLAVRGFMRDKELDVYDRNNLIARNVAMESHDILADASSKMRIFASVYLDPGVAAARREALARNIFTHYGEFVRLSIIFDKPGTPPVRVYNRDALKLAGLDDKTADAKIDTVALPTGDPPEGGSWVLNRTPSVELPLITVVTREKAPNGQTITLVGDLLPEALFNLFRYEGATRIYMLDAERRVLADADAARMAERRSAAGSALGNAIASSGGTNTTFRYTDEEDEKQLGTWAAVGIGNAIVVAYTPESEAFRATRQLVGNSVLIAVAVFLAAAIVSVLLARQMTRPLLFLSRATERIAKGEFGTTVEVSSMDEIGDLAASFNKMGEELKLRERNLEDARAALIQSEKMAAFGQLGAGIAHEVKNPLAGILGYAQLALRKLPPEATGLKNYLEIVEKETKRCKSIIENLLKFARQEKTVMDRVEVAALVDDSMKLVEHQLNMNGVKIERNVPPGLPPIFANGNQLQQVIMNLSINAQHAMEKNNGGTLTVSAVPGKLPTGEAVEIRVSDSGCGIPKEIMAKIFEPFFTTKPAGKGTGLGLSVTFGIIRDHKGKIEVDSQVGVGTTFRLILPVAPAVPADAPAETPADNPTQQQQGGT